MGVIATESTIRSDAYGRGAAPLRAELEVRSQACPLFVPLVEEGWLDDPVTEQVARRYLEPLLAAGIDTLVLGCTHYPLLEPVLARVAGDGRRAGRLGRRGGGRRRRRPRAARPRAPRARPTEDHFCVTDATERFERQARAILGRPVRLELVDLGGAEGGSK